MFSVRITVSGDRKLFERVSTRLRQPRTLMRMIGVHAMGQAGGRLESVLSPDPDAVRSGRLAASLTVGSTGGGGNADSVFELTDTSVTVGSNVPYAAMIQLGGVIEPREKKALAIPLLPVLQRNQISPFDLDPDRTLLKFVPYTGGKPNVFALLINPERAPTGRQRKMRGRLEAYPPGPLYALAYWVTREPAPFLYWDDEDNRVLNEELVPAWLGLGR